MMREALFCLFCVGLVVYQAHGIVSKRTYEYVNELLIKCNAQQGKRLYVRILFFITCIH